MQRVGLLRSVFSSKRNACCFLTSGAFAFLISFTIVTLVFLIVLVPTYFGAVLVSPASSSLSSVVASLKSDPTKILNFFMDLWKSFATVHNFIVDLANTYMLSIYPVVATIWDELLDIAVDFWNGVKTTICPNQDATDIAIKCPILGNLVEFIKLNLAVILDALFRFFDILNLFTPMSVLTAPSRILSWTMTVDQRYRNGTFLPHHTIKSVPLINPGVLDALLDIFEWVIVNLINILECLFFFILDIVLVVVNKVGVLTYWFEEGLFYINLF